MNAAGLSISPGTVAGTAEVMAAVAQAVQAQPSAGTIGYLTSVVQIQTLAEQTIAAALASAGAGATDIGTVESEYTESNVETLAANQTIGQLAYPAVAISSVTQGVGTSQPATFQFTVSLAGTPSASDPVSISYTTVDGSATAADGDFTPVSGTLTWAAGDTSSRTISVPVTDVAPAADEYFLVELSNPVNTEVQEANGVGEILSYAEYATTTVLTASTLSTPGQANVTLTAVVTNQDASNSPGTGQVTFYDGTTALGTSTLDATGTATLTTSWSALGSHTLTAFYNGYQAIGAIYDASTSPAVTETVTPAIQTITFDSVADQTYGANPITLYAESSLYLPVSLSVISGPGTLDDDVLTITGAGTIVVEATQAGDSYTAAATPVDLTIPVAPAPLTIAAGNETFAYGALYPTLSVAYSGFVNGDTAASLTALPTVSTAPAGSGVGTYAIDVSGAVDPDYTITYVPGTLTITAAPLTVLPADQTAVYGAAYPTLTATLSGALAGDLATLESELSLSTAPVGSGVGSYDIDASGITDPNYSVNYGTGTLTITPAPLVITASSISATYGAVPALTASYSGLVNGDTAASLTIQPSLIASPAGSSVGTYTITPAGAVDANYTITDVPGTLTITPAALTITANNQTIAYGEPLPTLTASYSGLTNGDSTASLAVPPVLSLATSATDAGSYTITVSGADDPNYVIAYVPGMLTINPDATATTIAPSLSEPSVGQDVVFTAAVISTSTGLPVATGDVMFRVDGQVVRDYVALNAYGEASFDPGPLALGPHTITATFAGTNDFLTSTETFNEVVYQYQTTTQLSESESEATYGDTVNFTATVTVLGSSTLTAAGSVQFEVDGQPSGSPVALDDDGSASLSLSTLDAGTHTITAIYQGDGSIFSGGGATAALVVTRAPLTISANDESTVYGEPLPALTASYSGFVNGDTPADLTTPVALSTAASAGSPAGTYAIQASGATSANYQITFVDGSLTVSQDTTTTTLSSSANASVYGQTVTITATVSAVAPGAGTPTGTVQFQVDGTNLGSPVSLDDGTAISEPISTLTIGNHTVIATYSGDNNFVASTSASLIQTVTMPLAVTLIAPVAPDPRNLAVPTIDVTFSEPINTSSLNPAALTLTDDGGANLINGGVSLTLVSGDTYAICGLSGLTAAQGLYTLTVNAADLKDQNANPGTGSLSTSWLMDTTAPTSHVVNSLGTSQSGDSFPVSVAYSDPVGAGGAGLRRLVGRSVCVGQ